ncbi:MAG: alanine--tRNA ligase-related protein [bacterium]
MESSEIRLKFLKFFENRGHKIISSSSLIPENDPSVLFTTAGMQQFKPYYTNPKDAEKDFGSRNIVTVQKCIRTGDIDEVGDAIHLTFFEMLGNFSFGGYGRKETITYAYDFITKELGLEISYVTFYKGEGVVPRDEESKDIWAGLGVKDIREDGSDVFWGPTGDSGPCGPTTEIYCKNANGEDVEIWNIVFNEYFCEASRELLDRGETRLKKLDVLGVDTGMGLERLLTIVQKKKSVYETDVFNNEKTKEERIIADHIKASIFIISDGVKPSNKESGSVLRRLMRYVISNKYVDIEKIVRIMVDKYYKQYPGLNITEVISEFNKEKEGYQASRTATGKALEERIRAIGPASPLTGYDVFRISSTLGTKPSDVIEMASDSGISPSPAYEEELDKASKKHQELSRTASAGMFKGGLTNTSEETKKLHTATHLLNTALRIVLGNHVMQKGSNITAERLRFDFTHPQKMTEEEKKRVEEIMNDKIAEKLPVGFIEMSKAEAEKIATHSFNEKYSNIVKVYSIGDEKTGYFSREFCGGPHVTNTKELGQFKIQKEEAVAQGIRRIKAVLL